MRRVSAIATATAILAAGAVAAGTAGATAAPSAHAARTFTVKLVSTNRGKVLATNGGFTLFLFTHDKRNVDTCTVPSGCAGTWPPYTTKGRPSAGPGVRASLLRTITISGGRRQVTYAGHPLYTYSGAAGPRDTSYFGFSSYGGTWEGVTASGAGRK